MDKKLLKELHFNTRIAIEAIGKINRSVPDAGLNRVLGTMLDYLNELKGAFEETIKKLN